MNLWCYNCGESNSYIGAANRPNVCGECGESFPSAAPKTASGSGSHGFEIPELSFLVGLVINSDSEPKLKSLGKRQN